MAIDDCFFHPAEIVNGIKGAVYEGGGSYVTVKKKLTLSDFPLLRQELYNFYTDPIDPEKYPWAGKILPVEKTLCEPLNSKLTKALHNNSNLSSWHLSKLFLEDNTTLEQDVYYTPRPGRARKFKTIEEVFSHYTPMLKGKTIKKNQNHAF